MFKVGDKLQAKVTVPYTIGQDPRSDRIRIGEVVTVESVDTNGRLQFREHAERYGPFDPGDFELFTGEKAQILSEKMTEYGRLHDAVENVHEIITSREFEIVKKDDLIMMIAQAKKLEDMMESAIRKTFADKNYRTTLEALGFRENPETGTWYMHTDKEDE